MKRCSKCGEEKPIDDFYRQKTSLDGHGSWCKVCNKANVKDWVAEHPEQAVAFSRRGRLKYRFGMTIEEHDALLDEQGGTCAICGRKRNGRRLHIDHDHDTGLVRGILCHQCNIGLGMFQNSPDALRAAIVYLS